MPQPEYEKLFPNVHPGWKRSMEEYLDLQVDSDVCSPKTRKVTEESDSNSESDSDEEVAKYSPGVGRFTRRRCIKKGKYFDLISVLSSGESDSLVRSTGSVDHHLVKTKSLMGKYILLCCVFLPARWDGLAAHCFRSLSLLSSELLSSRDDFEMVMVAKMRKHWEYDEHAFNLFFSAFPGRLAVPFWEQKLRDYICKSLKFKGEARAILVDPTQTILLYDAVSVFELLGADAFPFSEERLKEACVLEVHEPWQGNNRRSLEGLLGCHDDPSSFLLHRNPSVGKQLETVSVSQLREKLVGLYLCTTGNHLSAIHEVYQRCRDQGRDFEIVLVYLPFEVPVDANSFQDVINRALEKHNISWWVLPFTYSVCSRLRRICHEFAHGDALIVVGPNSKFVDPCGAGVITDFGIDAYPFTVEAVVQKQLTKMRALTLESLLTHGSIDYVCRSNNDSDRVCG